MSRDSDTAIGRGNARFPTTRRSAVLAAASEDPAERARALDTLLAIYWRPTYKHLRLHWSKANEDAKDLTQGFFASVLERDVFAAYDPAKGTFRTFLRTCLDRFVSNEAKAASRLKRGGGAVSLDFDSADAELSDAANGGTPEETFYREWARSLFSVAVERLESECRDQGKQTHLTLFERYDLDPSPEGRPTYDELAAEVNLPVTTVTNQLAAVRRHFRRIVLDLLRDSTATEAEFRAEARRLLGRDDP